MTVISIQSQVVHGHVGNSAAACKVLISGYLGSAEIAAVVLDFIRRAKARNPKLLYLCDPVMGDTGPGFYVTLCKPAASRSRRSQRRC